MKRSSIVTIVWFLLLLGLIGFGFWVDLSPQKTADRKRATIVYKLYAAGYDYQIRAQTGARTVTMPAHQPDIYQLVIYAQKGAWDTVVTIAVSNATYQRCKVLDTINLNSK
jgi:hypothetical protein